MRRLLLPLLVLFLFVSCAKGTKAPLSQQEEPEVIELPSFRLVVASDLHYIAPSLVEDYDYLSDVMMVSDGKCTQITHLIVERFIEEMLSLAPDAVVLTGDLTLNGEKESHKALRDLLSPLEEKGIKVLVLPGNHDVNHTAYRFTATGVVETEATKPQEFEDCWMDYGYGEALYQDPMSNSYMAELTEGLWLLALDSNTGSSGTVRTTTLKWMEEVLEEAEVKGAKVLSATHQNLFVHNPRFTFGYQLNNAKKVLDILEKHGVKLNLSGHLHIQHIVSDGLLTEIDSSSLSVTPLQYGLLEKYGDRVEYRTVEIKDEELQRIARETFDSATENKAAQKMAEAPEDDYTILMENAKRINREYFGGYISPTPEEEKKALDAYGDSFFASYITKLGEEGVDHRVWTAVSL